MFENQGDGRASPRNLRQQDTSRPGRHHSQATLTGRHPVAKKTEEATKINAMGREDL